MKFINPIVAPIIAPTIGRIVSYFRGPQAVQATDACPYRPPRGRENKKAASSSGDSTENKQD